MSPKSFQIKTLFAAITFIYAAHATAEDIVSSTTPLSASAIPALSPAKPVSPSDLVPLPFYPRLNLYAGTGSQTYGRADALVPLFGSANNIFYTDVDVSRNNEANRDLGIGLGARVAVNDDIMWGGYIFADRSRSNLNNVTNNWTTINPGIEFMTNHWDGRVNFYVPQGDKEKVLGTFPGDELGIPDAVTFSGHNQYDELYNISQEIGSGADTDFGYTFTDFKRLRLHGGGYYFRPQDTSKVSGVEVGVEFPINNYFALEANDTYDNVQKNKAVFSVRLTLGGTDKSSTPTVQDRLLDPVYRHFATLGTNTGVPVVGENVANGQSILERSNIWFFSSSSGTAFNSTNGAANCTYEHPCNGSSFTQTNTEAINSISANANFYFNPGNYTIGSIELPSGQSMYGRSADYRLPASTSSGYPAFIGTLAPLGSNTLDSFALFNDNGAYTAGIDIGNASTITLNNLRIGTLDATNGYQSAIFLNQSQNILVTNSTLNAFSNSGSAAVGVTAVNGSNATLNQNQINVTSGGTQGSTGVDDFDSTVALNGNTFTINSVAFAEGIHVQSGSATVDSNIFSITSNNNSSFPLTDFGVYVDSGTAVLNNNSFTISSTASSSVTSLNNLYGILGEGGAQITATNNVLNLTQTLPTPGSSNVEVGIANNGAGGTINASNNTISLAGNGNTAIGFLNFGAGATFTANNNTVNFTGSTTTKDCTSGTILGSGNTYNGGCT
jgi:hypothetical protein